MRLTTIVALALCLAVGSTAEAGLFGKKDKRPRLPTPADFPIPQKKLREDHKIGKKGGQHPPSYVGSLRVAAPASDRA